MSIINHKVQPIHNGLNTHNQDQVITLHNFSPTKRTVRRVPNSPEKLMLILSILLIFYCI